MNLLKDGTKLTGDDVREGLTAIISVKLTECEFEGQTKGRLGNPSVKPFVEKMVMEKLMNYLEENPVVARAIFDKSLSAQKAREAAKKARDLTRRKSAMESASCRASWQTVPKRNGKYRNLYRRGRLCRRFRQGGQRPEVSGNSAALGQNAERGKGTD